MVSRGATSRRARREGYLEGRDSPGLSLVGLTNLLAVVSLALNPYSRVS